MTDKNIMRFRAPLLLTAVGAVTLALNGCGGGATTGTSLLPTPASGPVVYGLQGTGAVSNVPLEVSGLGDPTDTSIAYITAATDSTAKPVPAIAVTNPNRPAEKTIALGFAPGATYIDAATFGDVVQPGKSVIFRAAISNGIDPATEKVIPIVPSSVVLTSPEIPGFSKPLTFTSDTTGPLANGTYTTASFALPFTTTGLHSFKVSVADTKPQSSDTTFKVAVVKSTDSVIVAQILDADGSAVTGAVATVTGGLPGGYVGPGQTKPADTTASVSDAQGMIVLFATPVPAGNTITVTKGALTGSDTQTLVAGKAFDNFPDPTFVPPDPQTTPPTEADILPYSITIDTASASIKKK